VSAVFDKYGQEFINSWKNKGHFEYKNQINNKTYLVTYEFYEDAKKHIITAHESSKITSPTLIIHGTSDSVVPYQSSVELCQNMKNIPTLILEKNATHGLDAVPENHELTREDMIAGTYRKESLIKFGDFLAQK
jgi:pimeloyl-ACP methyl ester carboxylesterase